MLTLMFQASLGGVAAAGEAEETSRLGSHKNGVLD